MQHGGWPAGFISPPLGFRAATAGVEPARRLVAQVPPWSEHGGLPIAHRRHFSLKNAPFYTFSISSIRYRHQRPVLSGAGRWRPRRRQRTGHLPPAVAGAAPPIRKAQPVPPFFPHEARPRGRRAIRPDAVVAACLLAHAQPRDLSGASPNPTSKAGTAAL